MFYNAIDNFTSLSNQAPGRIFKFLYMYCRPIRKSTFSEDSLEVIWFNTLS